MPEYGAAPRSIAQLGIVRTGLVAKVGQGALPLFGEHRQLSSAVMARFHLLQRMQIDAEIVDSACALLANKGLLLSMSHDESLFPGIGGYAIPLYRIDVTAITRLARHDFADLQMHHALELGLYQHSSLFHLGQRVGEPHG